VSQDPWSSDSVTFVVLIPVGIGLNASKVLRRGNGMLVLNKTMT
jgi:hypothetical protein